MEALKDLAEALFGYTGTGIVHDEAREPLRGFGLDAHRAVHWRELEGVVEQIGQEPALVGFLGSLCASDRIAKANHTGSKVIGTFLPWAGLMILLTMMNMLPMKMRM